MRRHAIAAIVLVLGSIHPILALAQDVAVTVRVENLGGTGSLFLTPFWLGVHDGTFDTYDFGSSAAMFSGIESLAEDGNPELLSMRFMTQQGGTYGAESTLAGTSVGMPQFEPGESASVVLNVEQPGVNRYLSYAAMVVPSNDAFVANENPLAYPLFDVAGNFMGPITIDIFGSDVNDAGTEVNSETSAAFLPEPYGQTGPNQGDDQGGVIMAHPGFNGSIGNPDGMPMNILGGMTATGATIDSVLGDFTRDGGNVPIARITIVPEPSVAIMAAAALLSFVAARRKRRLSV